MAETKNTDYSAKDIKILEGLEAVRKNFDVVELSKKIKRKGDILILSAELKIKPRILNSAYYEGRILDILPSISKSKASILASLRTDREVKILSKRYNLSNLSARAVRKKVREWNFEIESNPLLLLNNNEHEMILGTLMGEGSIRKRDKNSCLRFSHSIKQKEYCNYKKNILIEFVISEFSQRKRLKKNKVLHTIDFATRTHPVFNYYRKLFYKKGIKVISKELLEKLTPRALAFWICDDGSYCKKQEYIILCTNSFSLEEHKLMKDFFNKKFNLNPKIGFRDGKYYYLRFSKNDTKKLVSLIEPFISKMMRYKIGG